MGQQRGAQSSGGAWSHRRVHLSEKTPSLWRLPPSCAPALWPSSRVIAQSAPGDAALGGLGTLCRLQRRHPPPAALPVLWGQGRWAEPERPRLRSPGGHSPAASRSRYWRLELCPWRGAGSWTDKQRHNRRRGNWLENTKALNTPIMSRLRWLISKQRR